MKKSDTIKDETKIPVGRYCYCKQGCPYYEEVPYMKMDYNGTGYYSDVVKCSYLETDTMSLALEGKYLDAWYLYDNCKPCGININDDCE